jgi:hypothetical protein
LDRQNLSSETSGILSPQMHPGYVWYKSMGLSYGRNFTESILVERGWILQDPLYTTTTAISPSFGIHGFVKMTARNITTHFRHEKHLERAGLVTEKSRGKLEKWIPTIHCQLCAAIVQSKINSVYCLDRSSSTNAHALNYNHNNPVTTFYERAASSSCISGTTNAGLF